MESFIFREMNLACRTKDYSKIPYYGPLASALGLIIHKGNVHQHKKELYDEHGKFSTYRGTKMKKEEIYEKYTKLLENEDEDNLINLLGFISTSKDRN